MKKRAERVGRFHVRCPFCGHLCDSHTALTWCPGCYVEYYETKNFNVIFDTERKTERFAIAKALMKAGGARIGTRDADD